MLHLQSSPTRYTVRTVRARCRSAVSQLRSKPKNATNEREEKSGAHVFLLLRTCIRDERSGVEVGEFRAPEIGVVCLSSNRFDVSSRVSRVWESGQSPHCVPSRLYPNPHPPSLIFHDLFPPDECFPSRVHSPIKPRVSCVVRNHPRSLALENRIQQTTNHPLVSNQQTRESLPHRLHPIKIER